MNTLHHEILHRPEMSVLQIHLEAGQSCFAEPSAMTSMEPQIEMTAGLKGGLVSSIQRGIAGENIVLNTFRAPNQAGRVSFAPGPMGDILHVPLTGVGIRLQRGAYVASSAGVELTANWQGVKGFFSGEGLVLLNASGHGDLFFGTYGAILEQNVEFNQDFVVDTGYVVAFESTLDYQVTTLPGLRPSQKLKTFLLGGEGLVCRFRGSGRVWVQTRSPTTFASWINLYRPQKST